MLREKLSVCFCVKNHNNVNHNCYMKYFIQSYKLLLPLSVSFIWWKEEDNSQFLLWNSCQQISLPVLYIDTISHTNTCWSNQLLYISTPTIKGTQLTTDLDQQWMNEWLDGQRNTYFSAVCRVVLLQESPSPSTPARPLHTGHQRNPGTARSSQSLPRILPEYHAGDTALTIQREKEREWKTIIHSSCRTAM